MIRNDFFLIVPLLMVVSVLLVYIAVRRVDFPLLLIPLVACAVIALPIAYGAIKLAAVPGTLYWIYLAALVFCGAAVLTAVNHFLLLRQRRDQEDFQAEVETAYAEEFSEEPAEEPVEEEVAEEPAEEESQPETMESLFEYATAAKERGEIEEAITAYQKILRNFGNDEYAPFVAIDLSNLFKERASYADAIATCEYALSLPAVGRSATMSKEFSKNLEYLKVVQEVLTKHGILSTPFSEIPPDILAEIESVKK